MINAHAVIST